jgi:hypothetical protein
MSRAPRWTCPYCHHHFRAEPYDIGSGPELACPSCECCWGAAGQPLQPLGELPLPAGEDVGTLYFDFPPDE